MILKMLSIPPLLRTRAEPELVSNYWIFHLRISISYSYCQYLVVLITQRFNNISRNTTLELFITLTFSGRSYENNYKLSAHIAGVHKRIKKFRCTGCNESYIWKTGAIACEARHRNYHRCEYCDEVFPRLYEKIGHVADCHPMFGSAFEDADKMANDFNLDDFIDFEM
jgi:NAD-dependent SIR2 family protein deacetylase